MNILIRYDDLIYYLRCTGALGTSECNNTAFGVNILPPVFSAKINTKSKFSFKYGRVEILAKLPQGDWLFPGNKNRNIYYIYLLELITTFIGNITILINCKSYLITYNRDTIICIN